MTQHINQEPDRHPVLLIAVGRQRAGKTVFLTTVAQFVQERGSEVELWNADQQNLSNNLATFHADVHEPPTRDIADIKLWLDQRVSDIMEHRFDAILDVGGGETAFSRFSRGMDVTETLREVGVRVVLVAVMAPDPADVDYLEAFLAQGFDPKDILIVLNTGLVDSEGSTQHAFAPVTSHPVVTGAIIKGAKLLLFPALGCMNKVAEAGAGYREVVAGKRGEGCEPLSMINRSRVAAWWRKDVPAFMAKIPPSMLPAMKQAETGVVSTDAGRVRLANAAE